MLGKHSDVPKPRNVSFRSQVDFREQLITGLFAIGNPTYRSPLKRVSIIDSQVDKTPLEEHIHVLLPKRSWCVVCKGVRYNNRPKKRVALGEITANQKRLSSKRQTQ